MSDHSDNDDLDDVDDDSWQNMQDERDMWESRAGIAEADLKALREAAQRLVDSLPECDACYEKATRYDETIKYCDEDHAFLIDRPQYTISEALRDLLRCLGEKT